jgi:hypothetical protein
MEGDELNTTLPDPVELVVPVPPRATANVPVVIFVVDMDTLELVADVTLPY